ncbi:DUF1707 and DUF4190 domain-containing protein [Streptomyces sp. N50]|uniref:DUF1707 and DUF4190 domain-containing protein n=1 Tax=Streptomyces sp. N50 TaxID=3081765 RepID=UPI0029623F91|nr:DUF1707 and DUF4190 domain-containing protein [Streptomyces sp. N50]WOX11839.1 DUF1707 and DUF4190 domain-containing protein [Streptomyces sp. N50]
MSYPTPWQGQWPGPHQPPQGPSGASMLAATADRERTVDVLRAGFAEGRLREDELEKRVARAYGARTVGELMLLVADLPQGPQMLPAVQAPPPGFRPVPPTFLPPPVPPTNGKAVGSLVCGLLIVPTLGLTGIPAVILGHTARAEIQRTDQGGDGLALTGLIFGWLAVTGWALMLLLMIAATASST